MVAATLSENENGGETFNYANQSSVEIRVLEKKLEEEEDFEDGLFFETLDPLAASTDQLAIPEREASEDEDNIFDCGICQDKMTTPKSLPCLHNFCLKCLESYAKTLSVQDLNSGETIFQCPLCRVRTVVPGKGVEGFPTNFHVSRLQAQKQSLDLGYTLREAIEHLEEREDEMVEILQERKRISQAAVTQQRDKMVAQIDAYMETLHEKQREQFYVDSHRAIESLRQVKQRLMELKGKVAEEAPPSKSSGSLARLKHHAETVANVAQELEALRLSANQEQEKLLRRHLVFVPAEGYADYEVKYRFGYLTERLSSSSESLVVGPPGYMTSTMTSWSQIVIALLPAVMFVLIVKLYDAALDLED